MPVCKSVGRQVGQVVVVVVGIWAGVRGGNNGGPLGGSICSCKVLAVPVGRLNPSSLYQAMHEQMLALPILLALHTALQVGHTAGDGHVVHQFFLQPLSLDLLFAFSSLVFER